MERVRNESEDVVPMRVPNGNGSHFFVPRCFRFTPEDEELVSDFLHRKCNSLPLMIDVIADVDIYKFNPWELSDMSKYGENDWYFFTPRERKYPNSACEWLNRSAGIGSWKTTGPEKIIGNTIQGIKRSLVFYVGRYPQANKTNWIMKEYRLPRENRVIPSCISSKLVEVVLVRIYNKTGLNEICFPPERNRASTLAPSNSRFASFGTNLGNSITP
ncbi:protein ATAF2-like [Impatiens glandulifera]|uniref:protein ATAF2-like n=1 Tax=Impatiens glandulifera TaxID=253017 RepID=UPI001FB117BE|nr:protein ATAF2-like [Impatiens glandulifera]